MKPASFAYHEPTTVEEVLQLLAELGDEAKPLAGGQSLVPMMNFRLARPAHLIDLNRVGELSYVREEPDGTLRIGAMVRQRLVERSPLVRERWPLLHEAVGLIGHVHIRNRGTVGGSLAHADPAAELPATMLALDAEVVIRRLGGERTVPADEFFISYFTTAVEPDELLGEVRLAPPPLRTGWAYQELTRRHGDFALVGVAARLTLDDGVVSTARLAFAGAGPTPLRARRAETLLVGERPDERIFREAGAQAAEELEPDSDIHADAGYRREVASVLARRALAAALARAVEAGPAPSPSGRGLG